jgi:hypothetical protein
MKDMIMVDRVQEYQAKKPQKDILKMNGYEFADFMYRRKMKEQGWGSFMQFILF